MKRIAAFAVCAVCALALVACQKKEAPTAAPAAPPAPTAAAPAAPTPPPPPAAPGSIKGRVAWTGPMVEPARLNRSADPACGTTPAYDESVMVNTNKTLRNVLVRITGPLPSALPAVPAAKVTLEQKDCLYHPHVLGVVAGQTLEITNGDQTLHNIHTYKGQTSVSNKAQMAGGAPIEQVFKDDTALLKFKCDVHPWMSAFVSVTNHPWFSVTGTDGAFELKNVPPGTYDVEAWHEKFGTKATKVMVGVSAAETMFTYDGNEK